MKKIYQILGNEIYVKYEDENYVLKSDETLSDLSNFCKPKIENSEVIETATSEELEEWEQQKALQQIEAFNNEKKQDGQKYVSKLDNTVTAMLYGKPTDFVDPIVEDIEKYLRPLLDLIEKGQWYSAAKLVVGTPSNQDVIELKDMLVQDIVDYIRENYNHEVVIKDTTSIWDKIKNIFTN